MSHNTFGHLFRVTTFGESHGVAIGCVVDGCPPRIALEAAEIQAYLDKRKPGQSRFTTQRREADEVRILSGVFVDAASGRQVTTGTPIALLIENTDQKSKDYGEIKDKYRPGHADFTYDVKYGLRDYRGGGRASARETATRVAAGAIARKVLAGVIVRAALVQIGPHRIDRDRWDWDEVGRNPFFCPDADKAAFFEGYLDAIRKQGSSVGAVVEVVAENVPAGLGAPVYGKLDAELAGALMSVNAVKGVEIGDGFASAELTGEVNADEMRLGNDGKPLFLSNHAGGILGGISTGQPIVARFAVKPTSSILTPRLTVDRYGRETDIVTKGRHDPCVGIRAVPVAEAVVACVLADHFLRHRGQVGESAPWPFTEARGIPVESDDP
jgi:chorismate synthase